MSTLSSLPAELLVRITDYTSLADKCTLSILNSQFRKFLEPAIFRSIKATNRKKDASAIEAVVEQFGRHVDHLSIDIHLAPGPLRIPDDDDRLHADWRHNMPEVTRRLLSGEILSGIHSLGVTFVPKDDFSGYSDIDDWGEGSVGSGTIYIHDEAETEDEVAAQEQQMLYRDIVNKTFAALASRRASKMKELRLSRLIPRACSAFYTTEWQSFLSGLNSIKIDLWGGDNGAGWHSNTTDGYGSFILDLRALVFKFLKHVKSLYFAGDVGNPVGLDGWRHFALPIQPDDRPVLQRLELENCFIDLNLQRILEKRAQGLKTVCLTNCMSGGFGGNTGLAFYEYTWKDLFHAIRTHNTALSALLVEFDSVPLNYDEQFSETRPYVPSEDEPAEIQLVSQQMQDNPSLRLFAYSYLDDKYGMVFAMEEANLGAFQQGQDQVEYDALMDMVQKNRESLRKSD